MCQIHVYIFACDCREHNRLLWPVRCISKLNAKSHTLCPQAMYELMGVVRGQSCSICDENHKEGLKVEASFMSIKVLEKRKDTNGEPGQHDQALGQEDRDDNNARQSKIGAKRKFKEMRNKRRRELLEEEMQRWWKQPEADIFC